ncbi:nucleotidyltransferase domain-containing protein, partial [Paenibacillus senegalensis]|uniref:nucleotidyltransferase domain-containing protein n=1 Tax=Paenibacillus senegalensis TaxID=1465766 RepID=UPI00138AE594
MMKDSAFEAALNFVNKRFPNCDISILAGSASRGEETDSSDLDIVIIDSKISDFRESFEEFGWRIECFIHNFESVNRDFKSDRDKGRPVLATMIFEGIVLKDNGQARMLKEFADNFIKEGPEPLSQEYINSSRYFMFDLLDDFIDAKNQEEAIITLNTLSVQLIDFILRLHGQWSGRGKTLVRSLNQFDGDMSRRYFMALDKFYK